MTSPTELEKIIESCKLVAPGHNLPTNLRLAKLPRIKLAGAWLESRGNAFVLHRACLPPQICGHSYFQSVQSALSNQPSVGPRFCVCLEQYTTHYPNSLSNYLKTNGSSDFFQVKSKQLGGLLIYTPDSNAYFWLQKARPFENPDFRCSESLKWVNEGTFPRMPDREFGYMDDFLPY
jgi:hypothetical protein